MDRRRCRTPDICAIRRRCLERDRILSCLGGGAGSPLDRLLSLVAPTSTTSSSASSCVFLLSFAPLHTDATITSDHPNLHEMDFKW